MRTVIYTATPPAGDSGQKSFSGTASFDGNSVNIGETSTIDACALLPADTNSDSRIAIGEVTLYGAAWRKGQVWQTPPNPIPIDYVTRAGFLWRSGEVYHYDPSQVCPSCWVPGTGATTVEGFNSSRRHAEVAPEAQGTVTRVLPSSYTPSAASSISILVMPDAGVRVYAVEDAPPSGWTVTQINEGGAVGRRE